MAIELTDKQKKKLKRWWKDLEPEMTFLEFMVLYKEFLKLCRMNNVDPATMDFRSLVDPTLTYDESLNELRDKFFIKAPAKEPPEIKHWRERAEELEEKIRKLRKRKPRKVKELEKKLEEAKKQIEEREEKVRELKEKRPGISKEEIRKITKEMEKEISHSFEVVADKIKSLRERVRRLEKRKKKKPRKVPKEGGRRERPRKITKTARKWLEARAVRRGRYVEEYYTYDPKTREKTRYTSHDSALKLAKKWAKKRGRVIWVLFVERFPTRVTMYKVNEVTPKGEVKAMEEPIATFRP